MRTISFLFLLFLTALCHAADVEVLQQSTVDSAALTFADGSQTKFSNFPNGVTHQQFPLQTHRGYQYTTYYDAARQLCVGRRKLPEGAWEIIRFTDYHFASNDTHNVAVIGICANDGTIHLTWDHHVSDLNYRRSVVGLANDPEAFEWNPSVFGPVTDTLGPLGKLTQVTYPRFVPMPNGNLMLYYRFVTSGNGDSMIRVYDGTTSQWTTGHGKFIDRQIGTYTFGGNTSNFRYAYINGIGYGGNRLHCSWVWRDRFDRTDVNNQHDLCYAYSDDHGVTWNNSAGTRIAVTGSSFIHVDSPGLIVHPIEPNTGVSNQNTQFPYPDGGIHVMLPRFRDGTTSTKYYHHHWRDAAGVWRWEDTGVVSGSRPELLGDDERNLFLLYTSGGRLRILKGVPNAARTAWSWSLIHNSNTPPAAGEGQLDPSRWRSERVLSAYTQEMPSTILDYGTGTPFDGLPTPLRVIDFQLTLQAARPDPAHQAGNIPPNASLRWTAGLDAVSHRVYLGTDPASVASATTASPEYMGQPSTTVFTPVQPLIAGETYHWRVDEVAPGGVVRPGVLWSFTVAAPAPPVISMLPDQVTPINTPTPALEFAVTGEPDVEITGLSSDPQLVPDGNIVFGGSGSARTVTVTPSPDQTGFTDITVTASDALGSSQRVFRVQVVIPGAPVAHWAMDEGAGDIANDSSGNGFAGTLVNGAVWGGDATRGSFVSFDGEDDRILTPFSYALSSGADFTWAWWANQQSTGTEDDKAVMIGNRYPSPGAGGDTLEFIKFTPTGAEFANTGLAANVEKHIYQTIAPGGWHHYAMVKSGTSCQWYVDGVAQGAPVTINYNENSLIPFFIGGDDNGTGKTTEHFRGYLDDVVLYDRALSAAAVGKVMNGIYDPLVTLVTLGTPVEGGTPGVWSDGLAVHPAAQYLVPATGNLRSATGSYTFPGTSLTIDAGGRFQVRSLEGSSEITDVGALFLSGGPGFAAGEFAELTAGTGNNETNVLDGSLTNSGHSRFTTYGIVSGSTIARSLRVLSLVSGTGRIQAREGSAQSLSSVWIDNPANTFSGTWETSAGSNLVFGNAGAVGSADIEVTAGGSLEILGDWSASAALTVADAPGTHIGIGPHHWRVASLQLGSSLVPDGIYRPSQLDGSGGTTFTGTGSITVGSPGASEEWRFAHFGTTENAGVAADGFDANFDGESNLLEFATGQDPFASTRAETALALNGGNLEFRYARNNAAVGDGIQFAVQWSDSLTSGTWSGAGVSDVVDPVDPGSGDLQNRIATIPPGAQKRFVRLCVVSP